MPKKYISLKVDEKVWRRLDQRAKEEGTTIEDLLHRALREKYNLPGARRTRDRTADLKI